MTDYEIWHAMRRRRNVGRLCFESAVTDFFMNSLNFKLVLNWPRLQLHLDGLVFRRVEFGTTCPPQLSLSTHLSAGRVAKWPTGQLGTAQLAPARPVWPIVGSSLWANNINNTHFVSLPAIQPPACEPAACILARGLRISVSLFVFIKRNIAAST